MGSDSGSFLWRHQNNWVDRRKSTFSTMSLLFFKLLRMTSFLTRFCLVTPAMRLRRLISNTLYLLINSSVNVHVSALYSSMLRTWVSYTLILVLGLMSLDLHILLNRFNESPAKPIRLCTSGFEPPSSSNFPPRWTNSLTCLGLFPRTVLLGLPFQYQLYLCLVNVDSHSPSSYFHFLSHLSLPADDVHFLQLLQCRQQTWVSHNLFRVSHVPHYFPQPLSPYTVESFAEVNVTNVQLFAELNILFFSANCLRVNIWSMVHLPAVKPVVLLLRFHPFLISASVVGCMWTTC